MFPPVGPTRRHFLSQAAGVAAGGTVLALATIPPASAAAAPAALLDPVHRLIEAHRTARAAHLVALEEQNRFVLMDDHTFGDITEDACHADMDAWQELLSTAAATLAGLRAWAAYLDEIREVETWMLEEEGPTLVATLVEALGNLAVQS